MKGAPAYEWVAGGVGLALVAAAVGFTVWEGATESPLPPAFDVGVDRVETLNGLHTVVFTIRNTGETTGAQVTVRVTLRRDGVALDSAETTFDYVPAESSRTGGFIFRHDPRPLELEIGAISWTTP